MNKYQEAYDIIFGELIPMPELNEIDKKRLFDSVFLLQELVNKATPKKFNHITEGSVYCPNCDTILDKMYSRHYKYCPECGQKLDWSDKNE